ncbi:hypothetical protein [Amycolatopsis sp. NPDC059657]|uniref:hypothetical protein n=1 Tax=Amycolatopsis sp. NPDC059657 TaxID=3346899 RepID=UPI00366CB54F
MEAWRVVAAVGWGVVGVPLVLIVMAKIRDRTGSSGQVAIGGAIGVTVLILTAVLMLTVLPGVLTWVIVAVAAAAVSVMMLAS